MEKATLQKMFDNLLHIGNKTNFWSPRMKEYIYGETNGVHIINLVKTIDKLEEVKKRLNELSKDGKKILFVTTKIQGRDIFRKLAVDTNNYYVDEKWVPGLLTNFKTIKRRITTYIKFLKDRDLGAFDTLTKKEKASKLLELDKLDKAYAGLKDMKRLPDLIFIVDGIYELQAIKEANSLNIETISIFNTNGDESLVSNLIPANTNSPKSLSFIADYISTSIVAPVKTKPAQVKKIEKKPLKQEEKNETVKKVEKKEKKDEVKTTEKKEK